MRTSYNRIIGASRPSRFALSISSSQRERSAAAGAARCPNEPTYERRMTQLADTLERHFA